MVKQFRVKALSFLIFCPKPTGYCFSNVLKRFLFIPALGDATRECRTLGDNPSVF